MADILNISSSGEIINNNLDSITSSVLSSIMEKFAPFMPLFKIFAALIIIYFIIKIINSIISLSDHKRLVRLENKIDSIIENINSSSKQKAKKTKTK